VVDCFLSSHSQHAQESARALQKELALGEEPVYLLDCLTPTGGPCNVATLVETARAQVPNLNDRAGVVLVGHEGRLSDLVAELTGSRIRPLSHGEVLCLTAPRLTDFIAGQASVHYRYPTFDHQEQPLQSKVQSKMTVSTFLAGFVFTALSGLLLLTPDDWTLEQVVAAVSLTCSLVLFVACVYIYDQLGMPSGFWTDASRPRIWAALYRRGERRREERWQAIAEEVGSDRADKDQRPWLQDGPRYHLMLRTSRRLFTPGTLLALVGFLALLKGTGDGRIAVGALVGLFVAGCSSLAHRPDLGAD
jgi:phosphohistidine phosphatase SixA